MISQENSSGKPLADATWLENHHPAKIPERQAFVKKLVKLNPKKIIDLGCATGLWFELFDQALPKDCKFIGIDGDTNSLDVAIKRSKLWNRKSSFITRVIDLPDSLNIILWYRPILCDDH